MSLQPEKFSRIRLFGKRVRNRDLATFVSKELQTAAVSKGELAKSLGTSRPSLDALCALAQSMGMKADPPAIRRHAEFTAGFEQFCKLEEIEKWITFMDRKARGGKPFGGQRDYLTTFYAFCKTLKTHPGQLTIGGNPEEVLEHGREMMAEFMRHYKAGTAKLARNANVDRTDEAVITGVAYRVSKAVRDFMKCYGYQYPAGEGGVMSQSIAPFHGKYATVRMDEKTYQAIRDELEAEYSTHSDVWLYFAYGVEAFPRRSSIQKTMCKYEEIQQDGKTILVTQNFESKTSHYKNGLWTKYIFDPKLQAEIKSRKAAGYDYLFSEATRKNDEPIIEILKEKYRKHGLTEQGQKTPGDRESSYFIAKPVHCLRHVGAQRLLRATGWNVAFVASCGWKKPQELIDSYGELPAELRTKMLGAVEF